jgi:signal transduction histidine kinase
MTALVEDLLMLARGETGIAKMPFEPLDLREVVREASLEMRGLAELRQIRISASLGEEPAIVSGNGPSLHRLFVVLLDNAVKYSNSGGDVTVAIQASDGRIVVTVEDSGAGISPADLPHIFKRFYRADPARSGGGHGLGLALAENIAHAHGASIEVQSAEGAGARFRVLFPLGKAVADWLPQTAKVMG